MASSKEYLHFILEQLSDLEAVSYRSMMGEFMPAAICDLPYEGAKEMLLVNEVDSKAFLAKLFEAMYDELPPPKRKNNGIGGRTDELYSDYKRKY